MSTQHAPSPTVRARQTALEAELAALIVSVLHLEADAAELDPEEALFGTGLGLDSIDALEMALAISRDYGLELRSDGENNRAVFSSLRSLACHVGSHRTK